MEIQWKPYLWDEPRPVDPTEFERFEQDWGIALPAEYKRLAARYQGMTPTPSAFYVGHVEDAVCTLLTVHVDVWQHGQRGDGRACSGRQLPRVSGRSSPRACGTGVGVTAPSHVDRLTRPLI